MNKTYNAKSETLWTPAQTNEKSNNPQLSNFGISWTTIEPAEDPETELRNRQKTEYKDWLRCRQDLARLAWKPGDSTARVVFHLATEELVTESAQSTEKNIVALPGAVLAHSSKNTMEAPASLTWLQNLISEQATDNFWICLLQPGDTVDASTYPRLLVTINANPHAGLIYADEDALAPDGQPLAKFKSALDIDLLRSTPYLGRFLLMRARELLVLGGLDFSRAPYALHDYALRFIDKFGEKSILRLPEILFHEAATPQDSVQLEALAEVVQAHLQRNHIPAQLGAGLLPESLRVTYLHNSTPLVSILVPTKDQQPLLSRCLEAIIEKTSYKNYEILVIDNGSSDPEAVQYIEGLEGLGLPQLRVIRYPQEFNYSAMNNLAAKEAKGEYLLLLNNDTTVIQEAWLEALLNHAQRPEVGAVGAKLIRSDGKIQHAGILLGLRGVCDHPFLGEDASAPGYGGRLKLDQRYSAVSAACMMVRKSIYTQLGGLDEQHLDIVYNDTDFCLRLREAGYAVIWTPFAVVVHEGGASFSAQTAEISSSRLIRVRQNRATMYSRWMDKLVDDPAYNPNFKLSGHGFDLETSSLFYPSPPGQKKLLTHCADRWGSGLYRIISPTSTLLEQKLITGECHLDYLTPVEIHKAQPDSIVLQRQITEKQQDLIKNYLNYSKAKLIFELDDYLPNLPIANSAKAKFPRSVVKQMRRSMEMCNRIVVSTEPLKESLSQFHDEIVVLPNYLPFSLWGNIPKREPLLQPRRPRVGWAGGSSHTGDLRVIADIVRALADKVDWVFFGMKPEGVDDCIKEFHPGVHLGNYPAKLASLDLDLALAPLEDNIFNECKSNLRLLEYGICGYPVIATDIAPYQCGFPVTLTQNRFRDWKQAIEEKITDLQALRQEGTRLQEFVSQHWMLDGENLLRWRDGWLLSPDPVSS